MLRKFCSLGALVVVAVSFGVSNAAAAKPPKPTTSPVVQTLTSTFGGDGFSDGRFRN
jgi:hypothetical protein